MSEYRMTTYLFRNGSKKDKKVDEFILGYSGSLQEYMDKMILKHNLGSFVKTPKPGKHIYVNGRIEIEAGRNLQ